MAVAPDPAEAEKGRFVGSLHFATYAGMPIDSIPGEIFSFTYQFVIESQILCI